MAQAQASTGTVAGYFEKLTDAERAVSALRQAGFSSAHLGVASRGETVDSATGSSSADNLTTEHTASTTTGHVVHEAGEKAAGVWGKVKNFFEGGVEPYADERSQGDLANREVTPNPSDSYSTGASNADNYGSSDLHQTLSGMSVPDDRSRYLGHRFGSSENGAVVTVNAGDRVSEVESILTQYGADLGENAADYDYSANATPAANTQNTAGGTQNIQLLGEILRVQKDRVSRGEVSIRKEIITETQTVQVPVSREELVIERHAVTGDTPASGTIGDGNTIRIPLTEETASIDKSTVVREEVSVGKRSVEGTRDLSSDVRHEELVVDETAADKTRTGTPTR